MTEVLDDGTVKIIKVSSKLINGKTNNSASNLVLKQESKPENQDACGFYMPRNLSVLDNKGIVSCYSRWCQRLQKKQKDASSLIVHKSFLSDYYSTPDSWSTEHSASKVIYGIK